jgi:hypothetical protein
MIKVREPRPGFFAEALKRIQNRIPHYLELAIKESREPAGMTVMRYGDQCYLLVDKVLTVGERHAMMRAWPLYLAEHGAPPHKSRLRLAGPSELVRVEHE